MQLFILHAILCELPAFAGKNLCDEKKRSIGNFLQEFILIFLFSHEKSLQFPLACIIIMQANYAEFIKLGGRFS